jgi:hypothetical protein
VLLLTLLLELLEFEGLVVVTPDLEEGVVLTALLRLLFAEELLVVDCLTPVPE